MRKIITFMGLLLWIAAKPVSMAFAEPRVAPAEAPGGKVCWECFFTCNQSDPEQCSIIQGFMHLIHDLKNGAGNVGERFSALVGALKTYFKGMFGQMDDQIQSSQCHNRSCSEYGTKQRTP